MTRATVAHIGLGANLGRTVETMAAALSLLQNHHVSVERVSSLYRSAPVGPVTRQPPFDNAAARVRTLLAPRELLARCLDVERRLGRRRKNGPPKGPRPIDLDLLLYGPTVKRWPELELPHPELANRAFVVQPLVELDPDLIDPRTQTPLANHLPHLINDQQIEKVKGPTWWQT